MTTQALDAASSSVASSPRLHGLPLYLLVDPFFGEHPSLDLDVQSATSFEDLASRRQAAWSGRAVELPRAPDPVIEPRSLPYLVCVKDSEDPVLATALQMARDERDESLTSGQGIARIGALLETSWPADRVMERLQNMWVVSAGGARRYLRISDARVFELLTHLFEPREIHVWLGPIDHWHYFARDGSWHASDGDAADTLIDSEEAMYHRGHRHEAAAAATACLPWTAERSQSLAESQSLSRALTQLQRLGAYTGGDCHQRAWATIARARQHGLVSPDDVVAYTWRSLLDSGFAKSTACQMAIVSARGKPGSFDATLTQAETIDVHQEQRI